MVSDNPIPSDLIEVDWELVGTSFFDRYQILGDPIGRGGQGRVYKARSLLTGGLVVAKRIPFDKGAEDKLMRNAQALQNIGHHRTPIYLEHFFETDPRHGNEVEFYLVESLVRNEPESEEPAPSLAHLLADGRRFTEKEIHSIGVQTLKVLGEAHALAIIHRDMKPANLLLDNKSDVYVTDFGIAKILGNETKSHTRAAGSIDYMAPEQRGEGDAITPATDWFGFGFR